MLKKNSQFNRIVPNFLKKHGKNKYLIASVAFVFYIVFIDSYNVFNLADYHSKINDLEKSKSFYEAQNDIDKYELKELDSNDNLERLAREKYLMKQQDEEIFIIVEE